jgi:NAD(P)-dependent dehydrogenase (short-subunit alcohol dehydrogenase family)
MSHWSVQGKVAVVTGAARGLGAELARQLSARGARLALVGLETDELDRLAAELPRSAAFGADVTDCQALGRVADEVRDRMGSADILVANAGVAAAGPFRRSDPVSYDRVIEVNLLGSVRTVRVFLPQLLDTGGYILQIASVAALLPVPMMSAYCASKSGVEAMAHALRIELAEFGVDVGVAYLSWVDTDMVRGADSVPALATMRARMPAPFNRTYPADEAIGRLVSGIERRHAQIWFPGWVRLLVPVRGFIPRFNRLLMRREAAALDAQLDDGPIDLADRTGPTGLLGPGGAAANQAAPLHSNLDAYPAFAEKG